MATKNKNPEDKKKKTSSFNKVHLINLYMEYVLEHEKMPASIFKFCKENNLSEVHFYELCSSFEVLKKDVWNQFFNNTIALMEKNPEFKTFSTRDKLLTFYYTFFELLTLNRSYVLYALTEHPGILKNLDQLKGLRRRIKAYSTELILEENETKPVKLLKQSKTIFSEATWFQFLFLIKFWMDDNSAKFESTDIAIEKSVNTIFDLFDHTSLESLLDFGKFMWKEKMG